MSSDDFVLLPGRHGDPFAREVARYLERGLCPVEFVEFRDDGGPMSGETKIEIRQNIRGKHAYVLWSIAFTNYELMQVLQLIDTARLSCGARSVSLICPELPCARQDKTHERRESLSSRLVARLLEYVGLDEVMTCDLHSDQIEGHFRIPLDHIRTRPVWGHYIARRYKEWMTDYGLAAEGADLVLGVPDAGASRAVRELSDDVGRNLKTSARKIKIQLCHHDKMRLWERPHEVQTHGLLGNVRGKVVWFSDDLLSSGGTLFAAAAAARANGARYVACSVTHAHGFDRTDADGVLKGFAEALHESSIDELCVTDTHPRFLERVRRDPLLAAKTTVLAVTPLFGEDIQRLRSGNTIKEMMKEIPDYGRLYTVAHEPDPRPRLRPPA
ncbi:MAG: ribose-phosphate pyrophosphokinase [Deltaproteobacteria bacterium]|nr:ribose-phosphate pyrophosphokinase [Deltaproteobacteria bacterium]